MKIKGIPVKGLIFIPLFGAAVIMRQMPRNARDEAEVGIAGPIAELLRPQPVYILLISREHWGSGHRSPTLGFSSTCSIWCRLCHSMGVVCWPLLIVASGYWAFLDCWLSASGNGCMGNSRPGYCSSSCWLQRNFLHVTREPTRLKGKLTTMCRSPYASHLAYSTLAWPPFSCWV